MDLVLHCSKLRKGYRSIFLEIIYSYIVPDACASPLYNPSSFILRCAFAQTPSYQMLQLPQPMETPVIGEPKPLRRGDNLCVCGGLVSMVSVVLAKSGQPSSPWRFL